MLKPSERAAADRILSVLDGHTLAVKLAGAYASDANRPLEAVGAELEAARMGMARESTADAVELAFRQSVKKLPRGARRLFALFAAFATAEFGRNAALDVGRLLNVGNEEAHLEGLIRRALVTPSLNMHIPVTGDRERLYIHPLLRTLAEGMLRSWEDEAQIAAYRAVARYYAHYVNDAPDAALGPDERNIIAALEWTQARGEDELVASICDGMQYFWRDRGRAVTTEHYLPWGVAAATRIADASFEQDHRQRVARLELSYGFALKQSGQLDKAEEIFKRNLSLRRDIGDRRGEGVVLSSLGLLTQSIGRMDEAAEFFTQALAINREVGDRQGEGANLSYLGRLAQARGQLDEAEQLFTLALNRIREERDLHGEGADLAYLAQIAQAKSHWSEAEALLKQSLAIRREMQDRRGEGVVLSSLGQLRLAQGELEQAEQHLRESLAIRREVRDRAGEADDLSQFGRLCLDRGNYDEAERYFRESLSLHRELRDRASQGVVLSQLGLVAVERAEYEQAEQLLQQSLAIRLDVQDPRGESVDLSLLGRIALEQGNYERARTLYEQSLEIAVRVQNRRGEGVDLRQLGVIAEHDGEFDRAEACYRRSEEIARSVNNGLDIADVLLELGRFLCERRNDQSRGCALLAESRDRYDAIGSPGARRVAEVASRLGCHP